MRRVLFSGRSTDVARSGDSTRREPPHPPGPEQGRKAPPNPPRLFSEERGRVVRGRLDRCASHATQQGGAAWSQPPPHDEFPHRLPAIAAGGEGNFHTS